MGNNYIAVNMFDLSVTWTRVEPSAEALDSDETIWLMVDPRGSVFERTAAGWTFLHCQGGD